MDEVLTVVAAQKPLLEIIETLRYDTHPPLPLWISHVWVKIFGVSETALRVPFVLFGFGAIFMLYQVGRELSLEKEAGWGVLLASFSPFFILYSRLARWYSPMAFFDVLTLFIFLRAVKSSTKILWGLFTLSTLFSLYTNYSAFFLVASEICYFIWRKDRKNLAIWSFSVCLALLSLLPITKYLPYHWSSFSSGSRNPLALDLLGRLAYVFYSFAVGQTLFPWRFSLTVPAFCLWGVTGFYTIRALLKKERPPWLPFLPVLFLGLVLLPCLTYANVPRYLLSGCLIFYLLAGIGIEKMGLRMRGFVLTGILIVSSMGLLNLYRGEDYHRHSFLDDWRGIAGYVGQREKPGDIIIYYNDAFWYYHGEKPGVVLFGFPPPVLHARSWDYLLSQKTAVKLERLARHFRTKRIWFVYTPLSGSSAYPPPEEPIQWLRRWLAKEGFKLRDVASFGRDEAYQLKSYFAKRPLPEFRIQIYLYAKD